jgi:beta-galactosidase
VRQTEDFVEVTWKKYLLKGVTALTTYRVFADGTVRFILDCEPGADLPDLPEFGFLFAFSADLDRVTYYGLGPEENYCDRRCGAKLGVYSTGTKEMAGHYLTPQEA